MLSIIKKNVKARRLNHYSLGFTIPNLYRQVTGFKSGKSFDVYCDTEDFSIVFKPIGGKKDE